MTRQQPTRYEIEQLKMTLLDIAFDHQHRAVKRRAESLFYMMLMPNPDYIIAASFIDEVYNKDRGNYETYKH